MRYLDHFVMPVSDLVGARLRFSALGFTVANDANHPFGTQNCCIFFGDGTFIEPLAIGNETAYRQALLDNNAFVKGHFDYCDKHRTDGFSHLVLKSLDAAGDHADYLKNAISGGDILNFGRTFTKADGSTGEVAFRLAFAKAQSATDAAFFACEIIKSVPGGRGSLINHANGVLGAKRVVLSANCPIEHVWFLEQFLDADAKEILNGFEFETGNGKVVLSASNTLTESGFSAPFELSLHALVLQVRDLRLMRATLAQNQINVQETTDRLLVPPASGQGGTLIFEE